MAEMRELNTSLDRLLQKFFSTMDELYRCQTSLDSSLKDGNFLLAKSRYSMGAKAVGSLQYNLEDLEEAFLKVNVDDADDSAQTFTLGKTGVTVPTLAEKATEESGLRKRHVPSELASDEHGNIDASVASRIDELDLKSNEQTKGGSVLTVQKTSQRSGKKNPLNWYGVLVPQSLRQSQASFQRSVEQCCHLVNVREELFQLRREYRALYRRKVELQGGVRVHRCSGSPTGEGPQEGGMEAGVHRCSGSPSGEGPQEGGMEALVHRCSGSPSGEGPQEDGMEATAAAQDIQLEDEGLPVDLVEGMKLPSSLTNSDGFEEILAQNVPSVE